MEQDLVKENERLRKLLGEAQYIMSFHQHACPMNISNNYSGASEHLAMYRDVSTQLEEFKCEIDWSQYSSEMVERMRSKRQVRQ